MKPETEATFETLDIALFTNDEFEGDKKAIKKLEFYLSRWNKAAKILRIRLENAKKTD